MSTQQTPEVKWSGLKNWIIGFVLGLSGENLPVQAEDQDQEE